MRSRNVSVVEATTAATTPAGYRRFDMMFEQPVDHTNPDGLKFKQKLVLPHKDETEHMLLQTSGYAIFRVSLSAVANQFNASQIQVEHRFFSDSYPEVRDLSLLNIRQSAADFHPVVMAFRKIYSENYLNTGESKAA